MRWRTVLWGAIGRMRVKRAPTRGVVVSGKVLLQGNSY